VWSYGSKNS